MRWRLHALLLAAPLLAAPLLGCPPSAPDPQPLPDLPGIQVLQDWDADLAAAFYDAPWPSDLRRRADGTIDVEGYPRPADHARTGQLLALLDGVPDFSAFPTVVVRFGGGAPDLRPGDGPFPVSWDAPVLLARLGAAPALVPLRGQRLAVDDYTPVNTVAFQPMPGFVLEPGPHALILRRDLGDAWGEPLGAPAGLRAALAGDGSRWAEHLAPVRTLVEGDLLDADTVAAATVFTVRDVVRATQARMDAVRAGWQPEITDLALDPDDGADHARFCELRGQILLPQFQDGDPPFDTGGVWVLDGPEPQEQRTDAAPVTITLPRTPAPADGYPVVFYAHGTSGSSREVVDRGPITEEGGDRAVGLGPAHVLARHGIAAVGLAHLLVTERLGETVSRPYLNLDNLAAYPGTWQQGMADVSLLLDALERLDIDAAAFAGCDGPSAGPLDLSRLSLMGQSAGAHLSTKLAAIDSRPAALMPTGSGGFWSELLAGGSDVGGPPELFGLLLGTEVELTTLHPGLALLQMAWEPAEPMVFAPRVAERPLDGASPKDLFVPASAADGFFPEPIYDALAVAYGVERAGPTLWDSMDVGLELAGRRVDLAYPVAGNRDPVTAVVVQWAGDGLADSHGVFTQSPPLMHQYGCFLRSVVEGDPTVSAPGAAEDSPCDP